MSVYIDRSIQYSWIVCIQSGISELEYIYVHMYIYIYINAVLGAYAHMHICRDNAIHNAIHSIHHHTELLLPLVTKDHQPRMYEHLYLLQFCNSDSHNSTVATSRHVELWDSSPAFGLFYDVL